MRKTKKIAVIILLSVVTIISVILVRGDSWEKMSARTDIKRKIVYYTEKKGPDHGQTLAFRSELISLLIRQRFPRAALKERDSYISDLVSIGSQRPASIRNERSRIAHEFRRAGYLDIAIEEFAALEVEGGNSSGGLNASLWLISTLLKKERHLEAEAKCREILDSPERLEVLRKFKMWEPWASLAYCLASQERHGEAESAFYRAIALTAEAHGVDNIRVHRLGFSQAYNLEALGKEEEALELARRTLTALEASKFSTYERIKKLRELITRLDPVVNSTT